MRFESESTHYPHPGFFLLGGVKFSVVNVTGICLNTLGGIWYTVFKYKENRPAVEGGKLLETAEAGGHGLDAAGGTEELQPFLPATAAESLGNMRERRRDAQG